MTAAYLRRTDQPKHVKLKAIVQSCHCGAGWSRGACLIYTEHPSLALKMCALPCPDLSRMLGSQRLQYPLIQAYSSNHMRDPTILQGTFPCRTLIDPFKEPLGVYSLIKGYWSVWNAGTKEWPGFSTGSQNRGPELAASPRMREGLGYRVSLERGGFSGSCRR